MSLNLINLNKLLKAFALPDKKVTTLLRHDLRQDLAKELGETRGGGDFHTPFWSDVKSFVFDDSDLSELTKLRVITNSCRKRLYPKLEKGFFNWWNQERRFSNEKIKPYNARLKNRIHIEGTDTVVKVENFLSISIGDVDSRFIYPYFSESPALTEQYARLGLWLISEAFPENQIEDFRLLDVLRGRTFSIYECPLNGSESSEFQHHCLRLQEKWNTLKQDLK